MMKNQFEILSAPWTTLAGERVNKPLKKRMMKRPIHFKTAACVMVFSTGFILFWLYAAGSKLYHFDMFMAEMNNQVFSDHMSRILVYVIPVLEMTIAGLLVHTSTRLAGMLLGFSLLLTFTIYVGLALLNVYPHMPCNCAGLLGQNASWEANLIFNLLVTAVAAIGLILTTKERERRIKVWIP